MEYPLQLRGGVFLVCVGILCCAGALLAQSIQAYVIFASAGVALGVVCIFGVRKVALARSGRATRSQAWTAGGAISLEAAVFLAFGSTFFAMSPTHAIIAILGVVGVHFLIMRWSHGPLMLWLGVATLAWLAISLAASFPVRSIAFVDGVLKVLFGGIMALPLLGRPPVAESTISQR
jgi:hypothetical protein